MTSKVEKTKAAAALVMQQLPNESKARTVARTMLGPSGAHSMTLYRLLLRELGDSTDLTVEALIHELADQCADVSRGDLTRPEAMLLAQAHTLEALFGDLTRLAYKNLNSLDVVERLLRLAYRAQSQARATVETLAALKNPPMVFAKQANVTSGPQQVNNGLAREIATSVPNKLLERASGQRLDSCEASGSVGRDSRVAPLETLDGSQNARG
jgi:ABC-type arginine transport system ATPase subunit